MNECLFCNSGCKFCEPTNDHIPEWFTPAKGRPTQTKNVQRGLHPMGMKLLNAGIGERCGNCVHLYTRQMAGTYHKCAKVKDSRSPTTDIRKKWAGCEYWAIDTQKAKVQ